MRKQRQAATDFTMEKLPHNRVEVFFDCLKQRYDIWFKMGIVLFVFALPILLVVILRDNAYSIMAQNDELTADKILATKETFALINLLPLIIFSVGLAGVMKVVRQLVWGEGIFFFEDFKSGVKQNAIIYIFIFAVYGLVKMLVIYVESLIPVEIVNRIPTAVLAVTLLPIAMFTLTATVIYKDGFLKVFASSVKFYVKNAPITLAFVIILAAAFCVEYIPYVVAKYAVIAVVIIVLLPMYLIAWSLFANSVFDKMVNISLYPEYVDKGVYRLGAENDTEKSSGTDIEKATEITGETKTYTSEEKDAENREE